VPIYEPADDAIPAPEVPALTSSTRPFVQEITILQRERDQNAPSGCTPPARSWCCS